MADKEVYSLTKFDGTNFALWKFSVSFLLEAQDLIDYVRGTDNEPDKTNAVKEWREWKKLQSKASVILLGSVETSLHATLINCATPAEIWGKLNTLYGDTSEDVKQCTWQDFYKFRINDGEPVAAQIEKFETICKRLDNAGDKPSESAVMSRLLDSLSSKFSTFRMAWESTSKTERRKEILIARIIREDKRLTSTEEEESTLALKVRNLNLKSEKHTDKIGSSDHVKARKDKNKVEEMKRKFPCNYCHEKGHWFRECKKRAIDIANKEKTDKPSKTGETYNTMVLLSESSNEIESLWIADSGASMHMTPFQEIFQELKPPDKIKFVKVAGGKVLPVVGIGTVDITAYVNGKEEDRKLSDVLLVPDLKQNLFSVGAINKRGFSFHVVDGRCEVRNSSGVLSSVGVSHGQLFKMLFKTKIPVECHIVQENSLKLWHERLGHINIGSIKKTNDTNAVNGMKIENRSDFFCEACTLGKQARKPHFSSERMNEERPGLKIHSDVCGPISVESPGGARYFVLFKDDCTGYRSVYFLRHKSEVLNKFKEFEALVYRQTNNKIKVLRSDNGTEYVSKEFQDFLRSKGILHEKSTPYVPQQNGRAEREMRTLVESARSMLIAKTVPKYLWAEAIHTAAYILNRTVTKQLDGKTAYEKWFGRKPELQHLRIFGSIAYKNIPKEKRKKLDRKSIKMILVGYESESSNYRLWDEASRKVHISCDVIFNEQGGEKIAEEESSKQMVMSLDFGNYDYPVGEEEEEPEPADSSREEAQEIPQSTSVNNSEQVPVQQIGRRLRDRKTLRSPDRYSEFGYASIADVVPQTYDDAVSSAEAENWKTAMNEELSALLENKTWTLERLPNDQRTIACKWIYTKKLNIEGNVQRFKARLVARGFTQREGIDFSETFAPVVRYESIRVLLAIAAGDDLELAQFDITTAFLHGELKETIFMEQPQGFIDKKNPQAVCRLRKSLYGLKQSPRCWNSKFTDFLKEFGFCQNDSDNCVFVGKVNLVKVILALYVDDGLVLSKSKDAIKLVLEKLKEKFKVTIGNGKQFIGMEIERDQVNRTIKIKQEQYIKRMLNRFRMEDAKPVSTPLEAGLHLTKPENVTLHNVPYREAIGSLLFAARVTRPDIEFAVNKLSQFLTNYGQEHWQAVKRILRYLKGTADHGIIYGNSGSSRLLSGYTDADYAGCIDTRRSTTGLVFLL